MPYNSVPPGYKQVGTTPDGRPIVAPVQPGNASPGYGTPDMPGTGISGLSPEEQAARRGMAGAAGHGDPFAAAAGASPSMNMPKPPDFTSAAEKTARDNRIDQQNPFGATLTWETGPDGRPIQRQSFGTGGLGQGAAGIQQQFGSAYANPFSFDPTQARDQAINAAYGQATSRLDPMFNQREEKLRTQLLNQGLDPGSEAFKSSLANFGTERNDAYNSALNSAIGQGTQAGNMLFQQALQQRALPMQEMAGLNQFTGQANYQPGANYLQAAGLQDAANFRNWQGKNKADADWWGGLGNFGAGMVNAVGSVFGG